MGCWVKALLPSLCKRWWSTAAWTFCSPWNRFNVNEDTPLQVPCTLDKKALIFPVVYLSKLKKMPPKQPKEFIDTSIAGWALQRKGREGNAAAGWSLQGKEIAFHFPSAARWWISFHLENSHGYRIAVQLWPSGQFVSLWSLRVWLGL